jgi:hypothetical protein
MTTAGTTAIPSDQITVAAGSTVSIGVAFDATYTIVGGMDTTNGSATPGTATEVSNPTDAAALFGDDSELHRAARLAFRHPLDTLYAVGLNETETTESFGATTSGTLTNTPLFDPNLHGDKTVTATDGASNDIAVDIVYDDPPQTPGSSQTLALNPRTGDFEADSQRDYDITYSYADNYTTAISEATGQQSRVTTVLTEFESDGSTLATGLSDNATNFNFGHGFVGAPPREDTNNAATYATNYSDGLDDKRLSVVAPPRGTTSLDGNEARTIAEIGAWTAAQPLGTSATNKEGPLSGFDSLRTSLGTSNAQTFIDAQVTPLFDDNPRVIKDQTTSTTVRFERLYSNQIVDEGTARTHDVSADYVGGLNIAADRTQFKRSLRNQFLDMERNTPPLLDAFAVNVTPDSGNDNQVNVEVGLDVVDVVDNVVVDIAVGDVITNETE